FKPSIVLPRWAMVLPIPELEMVLRHEEEHVRFRDPLLLAASLVAVAACPWNPLVWWQMRRLRDAVEAACDRRVLRGGVLPHQYGELLVRLGSYRHLEVPLLPTISGSISQLERRLNLMNSLQRRISLPGALATMGASLLLFTVACTTEAPVSVEPNVSSR